MINPKINTGSLFIPIIIFVLSCTPDNNQLSTKTYVGSCTKKFKHVDGILDSIGVLFEQIFYDNQGRDSVVENYDSDGKLYLKTFLFYDSIGNKIKYVDYKPDGKVEATTEFIYSDDNLLLERNRKHVNGGYNKGQFIYNDKEERIKEIWTSKWYIDHTGEWYSSENILLRTYNDAGYCIGVKESADGKPFKDKKTVFDSLGHIIFEDWGDNYQKYTYDKNGNEIEHIYLDRNYTLVWRWVSIYDTNNVRIEYTKYNSLNEPVEMLKKEMIYK